MTFGGSGLDQQKSQAIVDLYAKTTGYDEIDTAILYQQGKTEKLLGQMNVGKKFKLAAKVNSHYPKQGPSAGLSKESLRKQFEVSLKNLKLTSVQLLYLHWPDYETPIAETLETLNELDKEGKFEAWGISNYSATQIEEIIEICKAKDYKLPSVYQGMYNYLTRTIEPELFPTIRKYGMKFYVYNPLAGGVLTGRYSFEDQPTSGRFDGGTTWGQKYRERFWKKELFSTLDEVKVAGAKENLSPVDVAFRWLCFHSKLQEGDAIIIGGSSINHIQSNLDSIQSAQPLNAELLEIIEKGWEQAKESCAPYHR